MVVFDATTLLCLLDPEAKAPADPETGEAITHVKGRIECLVRELQSAREKIIVPTPALSELLVRAGDAGPEYLDILGKAATFKIVDFDQRAAVEVAAATREALNSGGKKGGSESSWAKIKFDRQIIAIARVEGVSTIYSDDGDIVRFSKNAGITVVRLCDLPLPPQEAQQTLPLDKAEDDA
jgi:predicted nucleic acid-binding protein